MNIIQCEEEIMKMNGVHH